MDAAASGMKRNRRAGFPVSDDSVQTTGDSRVRQNLVVLAPVAGVKLTEERRPDRVRTILQSVSDGDKQEFVTRESEA